MKIGIIGAMEKEIEILKNQMTKKSIVNHHGFEFTSGKINSHEIVLLKSGIGKVNAAMSTTLLNDKYPCDFVINIGSAGGFDDQLNIGDIVIGKEIRNYDVDVTAFGYEYGQIPKLPAYFQSDKSLTSIAESCAMHFTAHKIVKGLIISGDSFMNNLVQINFIKEKFTRILAAEMEACAIAQVCYLFKTPFIIIRSISDSVGKDAHIIHDLNLELASHNSSTLVLYMLDKLIEMNNIAK